MLVPLSDRSEMHYAVNLNYDIMKSEIIIPLVKEENLAAAINRREKYSVTRNLQAEEFNRAIAKRISKNEEKQQNDLGIDAEPEPSASEL
jgi:hypothetical protein